MTDDIYDDITIEALARDKFGVHLDVAKMIVRQVPTSHTTHASVFLTDKKKLYAVIDGRAALTLGDVRKIVKRMGLVAESYVPPKDEPGYFDRVANDKFRSVFPGRTPVSEADLHYYRMLASYHPALVRIAEVSEGVIRQFDAQDSSNWRVAAKFAYRRIKTI